MKALVLMGSPRKNGNTAALLKPFCEEEEGVRRYCKHSPLRYLGSHAERHLGYDTVFMDADKEVRTRDFARELLKNV